MITTTIAGITYETNDAALIEIAKHCGPGFAARIAKKEGKIWRTIKTSSE